jgi:hypothetical protein
MTDQAEANWTPKQKLINLALNLFQQKNPQYVTGFETRKAFLNLSSEQQQVYLKEANNLYPTFYPNDATGTRGKRAPPPDVAAQPKKAKQEVVKAPSPLDNKYLFSGYIQRVGRLLYIQDKYKDVACYLGEQLTPAEWVKEQNKDRRTELKLYYALDTKTRKVVPQKSGGSKQWLDDRMRSCIISRHRLFYGFIRAVPMFWDDEAKTLTHRVKTSVDEGARYNAFVVDMKNHTVERFEPWGKYSDMDIIMDSWFRHWAKEHQLVYIAPTDFCPKEGPQLLQERYNSAATDPNGFASRYSRSCSVWSLWYMDQRLRNPDVMPRQIITNMLRDVTIEHSGNWNAFLEQYYEGVYAWEKKLYDQTVNTN